MTQPEIRVEWSLKDQNLEFAKYIKSHMNVCRNWLILLSIQTQAIIFPVLLTWHAKYFQLLSVSYDE